MLSLQEISDRLEIQDLLASYSHAIDRRNYAALDNLFTDDAIIDYSEMGGAAGTLPEMKAYLSRALQQFRGSQHLVATTALIITGDTATASSICQDWPFFCGLWYHDQLKRTPGGWRIRQRRQEKSYFYNVPPSFQPAPTIQPA
jgi:hypothetical protein